VDFATCCFLIDTDIDIELLAVLKVPTLSCCNIQNYWLVCLLIDWWVTVWATDMALDQDRSGWMDYVVLDLRVTLATVIIVAGVEATVHTVRTFPSRVIRQSSLLMVS